ncbi:MAG: peptide deformylase [Magnetococcales bacterium]|nr:peptide deformylase [Magnetococcales bacterium]MBF0115463.1 peptide deformylase [Magnetococcales bacterium]
MAILDILTYPDDRLREHAEEIEDFSDPALQCLIDDLLETMASLPACVGVAAPQTGRSLRLLVMDCGNGRKPPAHHHGQLVVINPDILHWSGTDIGREGCLSLPDYTGNVVRAQTVRVTFQDRQGVAQTLELTGYEARVMQHEIDHLDGRLFTDRIVSRKTDLFQRKNRL